MGSALEDCCHIQKSSTDDPAQTARLAPTAHTGATGWMPMESSRLAQLHTQSLLWNPGQLLLVTALFSSQNELPLLTSKGHGTISFALKFLPQRVFRMYIFHVSFCSPALWTHPWCTQLWLIHFYSYSVFCYTIFYLPFLLFDGIWVVLTQ